MLARVPNGTDAQDPRRPLIGPQGPPLHPIHTSAAITLAPHARSLRRAEFERRRGHAATRHLRLGKTPQERLRGTRTLPESTAPTPTPASASSPSPAVRRRRNSLPASLRLFSDRFRARCAPSQLPASFALDLVGHSTLCLPARRTPAVFRRSTPPPPTKPPLQTSPSLASATYRSGVPCRCFQTSAPLESALGRPSSVFFGVAPPREHVSGELRRRPGRPLALSHPIRDRRPRLERRPDRSGPRDRDPTT